MGSALVSQPAAVPLTSPHSRRSNRTNPPAEIQGSGSVAMIGNGINRMNRRFLCPPRL